MITCLFCVLDQFSLSERQHSHEKIDSEQCYYFYDVTYFQGVRDDQQSFFDHGGTSPGLIGFFASVNEK